MTEKKPVLSIIIVTYNNQKTIKPCIRSIIENIKDTDYELIIIDNKSNDNTLQIIKNLAEEIQTKTRIQNNSKLKTFVTLIANNKNIGFSKANNQGINAAKGEYILLLNPDVIIKKISFNKLIEQFKKYPRLGALTIDLFRPQGTRDLACHRGFPTLWRSLCYFFGLEKLFSWSQFLSKIFGGYHLLYMPFDKPHFIESPSGAFYLTKMSILKEVGGLDEDYFMYGEDIDLSYRLAQKKYKALFFPEFTATHIKYQSGLNSKNVINQKKTKKFFFQAMQIFYNKHYARKHPQVLNLTINLIIRIMHLISS